jgi:tetratricopeptide (TPR) repeat protein
MDLKKSDNKNKSGQEALKKWGGTVVFWVVVVTFLTVATKWKPVWLDAKKNTTLSQWAIQAYGEAWTSTQQKVDQLKHLDEENAKLQLENAHLRLALETERFETSSNKASQATHDFESKLSHETGSKTGRTLASIPYKVPTDLSGAQLYVLANGYFKQHDDEKAAVIYTFLTGLEDDNTFKTAPAYLRTGIAWYRLENMELADYYFDKVLKFTFSSQTQQFINQARLWRGITAERTGDHKKSQALLRDLLEHNPHSTEAAWVNRELASKKDHDDQKHETE